MSALPLPAEPSADAEQPWLGLDSFNEATRGLFYGRDEEVAELTRRVMRKPLTVLFGQSGLGKTSILRAGLVPRLRPQGYCPVYVRIDYARESPPPAEQIKQAIFRETQASGTWSQTGVAVDGESLWEFLHHRDDLLRDADGRTLTPLLIFDQFEEIFTLAQGDEFGRARATQFVNELGDLVENRPPKALEARLDADDELAARFDFARCDYRVLIALREDYLAHLEGLKAAMPSITQNRMRLARMTGQQALDAVIKPGGTLVSQEVAEAIVRFVAGGAELRNAEVEPSLLSLICRELNAARIAQGRSEISADLLAGSHATILAEFYQRALADQPAGVHRFIEEALLTDSCFRENVAQEKVIKAFADAGAAPDALAKLVDRRLLRVEERLDVRRVELTHDVLCGVVRASRDNRHEREARDEAERQLAMQRERETATRQALKRARKIAAACAALALVAVGAAAFGIYGMRHAQDTRTMAEAARGESERLVVYLLDDFYRELEPVGRLDLVGELAQRAIAYYEGLPAALQTADTTRNRALAQVRLGAVYRRQSKIDDARTVLDDAVPALQRQFDQGDRSEPTLIGLAQGLMTQSRVADSSGRDEQALATSERAIAVLKPQAEAVGASLNLRRAYAQIAWQHGFTQMRSGHEEASIDFFETALKYLRGIDDLSLKDIDVATQFAEASAWLSEAFGRLNRPDAARAAGLEGREVATRILVVRPTHQPALRARALLGGALADVAGAEMRQADQLALALEAARDWRTSTMIDPTNAISWHNLAASRMNAQAALSDMGRLREAQAVLRENREVEPIASQRGLSSSVMVNSYARQAFLAGEFDDPAAARQLYKDAQRHAQMQLKLVGDDPFGRNALLAEFANINFEVAWSIGDEALMNEVFKGQRERLEGLEAATEGAQRFKIEQLSRMHFDLGRAALLRGDAKGAADALQAGVEQRSKLPNRTVSEQQFTAIQAVFLAVALAGSGRAAEARETIGPTLRFLRETERRNVDDQGLRLLLAQALYANALADPAQAKALLAEARALVKGLPPDLRTARSSRWWMERIAEGR
jgi:tetratricopeptide (TPR) repeat protein